MDVSAPWLKFYGDIPHSLDYPDCSMAGLVFSAAEKYPEIHAYDFMGTKVTYASLVGKIRRCAGALSALGIGDGDRVTICMPNTPQAVIMFYAVNLIGAVANMVHPLSAEEELVFYLNSSHSTAALTLDLIYPKFAGILDRTSLKALIVTDICDGLSLVGKAAYRITQRRKKVSWDGRVVSWNDFMNGSRSTAADCFAEKHGGDTAAILYSGGTTGTVKGIMLTNLNFNALSMQTAAAGNCITAGHRMLSVMPIFHGFGLGVCIHTMLANGVTCVLVPQFSVQSYAKLLKKYKPNYLAGVPTLYEALLKTKVADRLNMSQLEGIFSGGDSLAPELKSRVDVFLKTHGASEQIREGYGLTECVTASCLTPRSFHREGSIGIPFPDTFYKIVEPGTDRALSSGETGEICLSGPSVMKGYADNPEETALALRPHTDGRIWLHTGDLGMMDEDGFLYFRQRIKRVIMSSGYSIFPSQIENIICAHESVLACCVIGVPDPYRMRKVKAFVVLRDGFEPTQELKASLRGYCARYIAKYAMPYEFEFRASLPRTLVGKIAYTVLEKEESDKAARAEGQ